MSRFNRVLSLAFVVCPMTAAAADAQVLLELDGIELLGSAQLLLPGASSCNVLESDTSYEAKKGNHGVPMDLWRLDFTVRNGSGRWLDHLIARYQISSEWPDCTNWTKPESFLLEQIDWTSTGGFVQESGRNVVAPGATLTETKFIIVLRGDPAPHFANWSVDFDFGQTLPATASGPARDSGQDSAAVEAGLSLDQATRRLIQRRLQAEGFDPGEADGLFGPITRAAIRQWQAARGVAATGYLDAFAAAALRTDVDEAAGMPRRQAEPQVDPRWQARLQTTLRRLVRALAVDGSTDRVPAAVSPEPERVDARPPSKPVPQTPSARHSAERQALVEELPTDPIQTTESTENTGFCGLPINAPTSILVRTQGPGGSFFNDCVATAGILDGPAPEVDCDLMDQRELFDHCGLPHTRYDQESDASFMARWETYYPATVALDDGPYCTATHPTQNARGTLTFWLYRMPAVVEGGRRRLGNEAQRCTAARFGLPLNVDYTLLQPESVEGR